MMAWVIKSLTFPAASMTRNATEVPEPPKGLMLTVTVLFATLTSPAETSIH